MTRILGIDPGSRATGFGIIEFSENRAVYVTSGYIPVRGEDLAVKLKVIFEGVTEIVETHRPTEMGIEQVFMHRNAASALKLGQARGAALLAGVMRTLPVYEYTPAQIKQAITGKGNADKVQVQHMIKILLCLQKPPQSDAADALAVAICHGHTRETVNRISRARTTGGHWPV